MPPLGSIAPSRSAPGPPAWQASSRWRPCWDRSVTLQRRVLPRPVHSPPPIRSRTRSWPRPRTASRSPLPSRSTSRAPASAFSARAAVRSPSAKSREMTPSPPASPRGRRERWAQVTTPWSGLPTQRTTVRFSPAPTRSAPESRRTPVRPNSTASGPRRGPSFRAGSSSWAHPSPPAGSSGPDSSPSGAGGSTPGSPVRTGTMAIGALAALLATALLPFLNRLLSPADDSLPPLAESLWAMPLGWWIQLVALFILALLCLGLLAIGRATTRLPAPIIWVGLGSGLAALVGLSLTDYALSVPLSLGRCPGPCGLPLDTGADRSRDRTSMVDGALAVGIALPRGRLARARFGYFPLPPRPLDWRRRSSAISILTGLAEDMASLLLGRGPPHRSLRSGAGRQRCHRPDHSGLGSLGDGPAPAPNAARAGRSLVAQGVLALVALFLAAVLALMALPGTGRARDLGRRRAGGCRPGRSHRVWDGGAPPSIC